MVYINYICSNLSTNVKLFADDTSLFELNESFKNLSNLCIISNGGYQWKTSFNPDRFKQAQEVIFQEKTSIQSLLVLTFDNSPVVRTTHHKHLGLILKGKLNFKEHLKEKISEAVMRKLQNIIPENSIQTIHKSFIRPHLDDGDINYHQPKNRSFCQKIEFIQYQAALAITGVIHGTSQTNLYNELGISQ